MSPLDTVVANIASGQAESAAVNLGGLRLFGVVMPAAWTAASLSFSMSADGGATWVPVYDATGTEVTAQVGASRFVAVDPLPFSAAQMVKVRSGTFATPVAQGADRALTLVLRGI